MVVIAVVLLALVVMMSNDAGKSTLSQGIDFSNPLVLLFGFLIIAVGAILVFIKSKSHN